MSNLEASPSPTASEERRPSEDHPVREVLPGRDTDLGEGTHVRRFLPTPVRATVGAWCFVDHFGPFDTAGRPGMRIPPHPHTGLQTVTWLLEGDVLHRDSLGSLQLIRPGQLNLMTAGRGLAHSEESPAGHGAHLHGVQLWVALPSASSAVEPAFDHLPSLPVVGEGSVRVTLLVGELDGERSPARAWSGLFGADVEVPGPATGPVDLPAREDFEYGAMLLQGEAMVEGVPLPAGDLLYLGRGRRSIAITADAPARLLLLGGEPYTEPLFMWWNFVANSAEEIEKARADWEAGRRFGEVRGFDGPRLPAPSLPAGRLRPRPRPQP